MEDFRANASTKSGEREVCAECRLSALIRRTHVNFNAEISNRIRHSGKAQFESLSLAQALPCVCLVKTSDFHECHCWSTLLLHKVECRPLVKARCISFAFNDSLTQ